MSHLTPRDESGGSRSLVGRLAAAGFVPVWNALLFLAITTIDGTVGPIMQTVPRAAPRTELEFRDPDYELFKTLKPAKASSGDDEAEPDTRRA